MGKKPVLASWSSLCRPADHLLVLLLLLLVPFSHCTGSGIICLTSTRSMSRLSTMTRPRTAVTSPGGYMHADRPTDRQTHVHTRRTLADARALASLEQPVPDHRFDIMLLGLACDVAMLRMTGLWIASLVCFSPWSTSTRWVGGWVGGNDTHTEDTYSQSSNQSISQSVSFTASMSGPRQ